MKNRHLTIPITSLVVVALALHPLRGQSNAATLVTPTGSVVPDPAIAPSPAAPAPTGSLTSASPSPSAATAPTPAAPAPATKPAPPHTIPYTVLKGDTLTKLSNKFNTTRKKLKDLNGLASYKLTPGQVIFVPGSAKKSTLAANAKAKRHTSPPVDYDIPASTFASCPVKPSNEDDSDLISTYGKAPPIAQLVSPSEMAADQQKQDRAAQAAAQVRLSASITPARLSLPPALDATPATTGTITSTAKPKGKTKAKLAPALATTAAMSPAPAPAGWSNETSLSSTSSRQQPSGFSRFWNSLTGSSSNSDVGMNTPAYDPSNQWGYKFLRTARELGDRGIDYDDDWRPPGEHSSWVMDCSNTSRWLYKSVAGINLPRTASDQYYYLHLQGKAWDVPTSDYGLPDVAYLQRNLKPGDLLFWQNTYKPERSPPITHVMVFLGTNERGQWIMAGSQSSHGGEHNRSNGGPDVYVFRPSQPCGGWSSWFGLHRHVGRFCAFGRPLEADPSKFAEND